MSRLCVFLKVLKPELAGKAIDDPALEAAQQELAEIQSRARELVNADPSVERVRWQLDRRWYEERGIPLNPT